MTVAFILFLLTLLIGVPMRIWEYMTAIDAKTGFFEHMGFSVWGLQVLLLVSAVVIAFLVIREKNTMDYPYRNGTKALGLIFFAVGAIGILLAVYQVPLMDTPDARQSQSMILAGMIVNSVFGVACLVSAVSFFARKTQNSLTRLMLLVPVIWSLVRLWSIYMGEKPILTVSAHLYELTGYLCLAMFLMALSYCVAGFNMVRHTKRVVFFGLMGSVFLLLDSIAVLVMQVLGKGEVMPMAQLVPLLMQLALGLLMLSAPIYICFGVDPLLDYRVLYESGGPGEDPLEPEPSQLPMGPAPQKPGGASAMAGMQSGMIRSNPATAADSVDEAYRYSYDQNYGEGNDLTQKAVPLPEKLFYTNPNYQDVNMAELYELTNTLPPITDAKTTEGGEKH